MRLTEQITQAITLDGLSDEELILELSEAPRYDADGKALNAQALPLTILTPLREKAFVRLAEAALGRSAPEVAAELTTWAEAMTAQHDGDTVKIRACVLPWIPALAVVRYGEAPDFWPSAFSAEDVARARAWLSGENIPFVISGRGRGATGTLS